MRAVTALPLIARGASSRPMQLGQPTLEALGWADSLADSLRADLLAKAKGMPDWRRGRVAFVVREDGVELTDRRDLAEHYRRNGLRSLAIRVRQAPIGIDLVILEGDEVAVIPYDLQAWVRKETA